MDPSLSDAYRLASLFHCDGDVAAVIAERAMMRLDGAVDAQIKRLYYTPAAAESRSKIYFPHVALLQFLVFTESEPFELWSEQRGTVAPAMMALRYVKHLVATSARRNSFHAAVAICRLLFGYSTAETMAVYGALLHEDAMVKEDGYFRARKRVLMSEVEQRFEGVMRIRGRGAEERFAPAPEQERWSEAVFSALSVCTPWDSTCAAPALLAARPHDAEAEIGRLHALIHPPCFRALAAYAGMAAPEARLAFPRLDRPTAATPGREAPAPCVTAGRDGDPRSVCGRSARRAPAPAGRSHSAVP